MRERYLSEKGAGGRASCATVGFKTVVLCGIYFFIVNVPSFTKRDCPLVPSDTAFSLAPIGVPLIDSDPTVVDASFSLLTRA